MMTESAAATELSVYQAVAAKTAEMLEAAKEQDLARLEKLSDERDLLMHTLQQMATPALNPVARDQKAHLITEILAQETTLQSTVATWRRHISGLMRINRVQRTLSVAYTPETTPT